MGVRSEEWRVTTGVVNLATEMRVQGLLQLALDAGLLVADDPARRDVHDAVVSAVLRKMAAESWAVEALSVFDRRGVEACALKGLAIAHLDHSNPRERMFGDADLLIRRADYSRAMAALAAAGFHRVSPPVRKWWEQRFAKAIVLRTPSGGELDLHLAITGGYFGSRIDHARLWKTHSQLFDLDGRPSVGLDGEGRWLHACCHVVLGGGSGLRAERDVAQLLLVSRVDWEAVVADAEREGVDIVIAEAINSTWRDLQLAADHPAAQWACAHHADQRQQRALEGYRQATSVGWGPEGRSQLRALGPVDRVLFLTGLAMPSRASRRFRQRTLGSHLRSGIATARGRKP
ncbi:MAG: nucleotidyltransferase family protein [Actinomycetota bacterium]